MDEILRQYQDEMGWNDQTLVHILSEYIANQQDDDCFAEFIQRIADEEKELCGEEY